MKRAPSRAIVLATSLAVLMHLLLFASIRPNNDVGLGGMPVPPKTTYLMQSEEDLPMSAKEVRTIRSPVLFSLPSRMGFSRELTEQDVETRLTFSQDVESEQFLSINYAGLQSKRMIDPKSLMLTATDPSGPDLPTEIYQFKGKQVAAPRVNLAPQLKERLDGGIVLPPELNKESANPWAIHASLSVSEAGMVQHVFLDQPLELVELNQQLLQLLYGLRFKPGKRIEAGLDIYSPESATIVEDIP